MYNYYPVYLSIIIILSAYIIPWSHYTVTIYLSLIWLYNATSVWLWGGSSGNHTIDTQCEVYVEYFAYVNYFDHGFGSPLSEWSV